MSTNDLVLVKELVTQRKNEVATELSYSEYFEIFAAEQALKDRDLSYNEIEDGIVDGGGDGGIDSIFLFINNTLCREEIDSEEYKRHVPMELFFIQAKISSGFSEQGMEKFISSARDLLNLDCDIKKLDSVYNSDLLEKISLFRTCFLRLASKFPKLSIHYRYAALAIEVHPNVKRKRDHLEETVKGLFTAEFSFEFLTASSLLRLARQSPISVHQLKLAETQISTGQNAYVCLVNLHDYFLFITDSGLLNERIFEGNVRDYQGNTEVNKKIRDTLTQPTDEDFWWLNNGITIICTRATVSAKTITIENAEVVNGLQTSREIYDVLSAHPGGNDNRSVLVRVIETEVDEVRDRIIRATNSQTSIPSASLRATDKIHRDIEDYLSVRGYFYDRRKNYYKNLGKPVGKIVSIGFLAQSVLACALGDPANARARPSSLIKRDEDYFLIFNEDYPLDVYYISVVLAIRVAEVLRSDKCTVPRSHWNNIRFYISMLVATRLLDTIIPSPIKIAKVEHTMITRKLIFRCISDVWDEYSKLGASDQVAKGTELRERILKAEKSRLKDKSKRPISLKRRRNSPRRDEMN